jgi:predicted small secreted protein
MKRIILGIVIVIVLAGLVAGCGTSGQTSGTGILELYLSDAPTDAENITGVYITINEIQYHMDDQWITCEEFEGPQTFNLLELTDGNSTLLGELVLPGGHYNQIRFILDAPEMGQDPDNPGCYIEFVDNSTEPLFVPSGNTTGFKAVGEFTVPVNGTVAITTDFDVRKSVHLAASHYILWPTIRTVVNNEAGRISGVITNNSTYTDIIVFAYEDGTWADTEDDEPVYPASRFPNAVNSGKMCDDGHYTIPYLAAGTYDLAVAGYNGADFGEVLGFISDVVVESNHTTIQNIDTDALETSL